MGCEKLAMPMFHYRARDARGQFSQDTIEAPSLRLAAEQLKIKQLVILAIQEAPFPPASKSKILALGAFLVVAVLFGLTRTR